MTRHRLGVLGAGVMGTAIATLGIGMGIPVVLVDVDDEKLAKARSRSPTSGGWPS